MAKTYNTLGTVAPGDVLRANSGTASYNGLITNVNNYRVPAIGTFTASQSAADATNQVVTLTEVTDTDSMFTSGTTVTINTAGIYLFTMSVGWSGVDVRADCWINHSVGGVIVRDTRYGTIERNAVSIAYPCSAAETVSVYVYQDNTLTASRTATVAFSAIWQGQAS